MNKSKINWCDSTWNPVTGCLHGCEYCYAERNAHRFVKKMPDYSGYPQANNGMHCVESKFRDNPYPYLFEPTYHRYRLCEPAQKTKPQTIFVCSMADLFGKWVPDDVICEVLEACKAAPQHRYLFLTKNPFRYFILYKLGKLPLLQNMWYGATVTGPEELEFLYTSYDTFWVSEYNTFLSIEPIHSSFRWVDLIGLMNIKWIILGAETGDRPDKILPKREWIESVKYACHTKERPLYMKDNLSQVYDGEFVKEFPWKEDDDETDSV